MEKIEDHPRLQKTLPPASATFLLAIWAIFPEGCKVVEAELGSLQIAEKGSFLFLLFTK
jgi:hypothetical protein